MCWITPTAITWVVTAFTRDRLPEPTSKWEGETMPEKCKLGYLREDEVKLIRRKHRIGVRLNEIGRNGNTAGEIMSLLSKVPASATFDDIEIPEADDDTTVCLWFHEERRE